MKTYIVERRQELINLEVWGKLASFDKKKDSIRFVNNMALAYIRCRIIEVNK